MIIQWTFASNFVVYTWEKVPIYRPCIISFSIPSDKTSWMQQYLFNGNVIPTNAPTSLHTTEITLTMPCIVVKLSRLIGFLVSTNHNQQKYCFTSFAQFYLWWIYRESREPCFDRQSDNYVFFEVSFVQFSFIFPLINSWIYCILLFPRILCYVVMSNILLFICLLGLCEYNAKCAVRSAQS